MVPDEARRAKSGPPFSFPPVRLPGR